VAGANSVDRVSKQVNLSPRARDVFDNLKRDYGITQQLAVERAVEWLMTLPPAVMQEVFRREGDPTGTLVRLKMAEAVGAGDATTVEQAAAIARQQVDRLERIATAYRRELEDHAVGDTSKGKKRTGKNGG
jgi:hypothetical protein